MDIDKDLEQNAFEQARTQADSLASLKSGGDVHGGRSGVAVQPSLPGAHLPVPVVTNLEVSQGVDGVFSTFDLGYEGSEGSQFRTYLNPETLAVDQDRMTYSSDQFPVAHSAAVDKQIQDLCKERGIDPLIKLEDAQEWISSTLGGDFEILKTKSGMQLQGAGGIWTRQGSITDVIDRIENHLVDDLHFIRDVGKAVGYPQNLHNDRNELDYRHSAFIRSKIEAAMDKRPDEISLKIREISENQDKNPVKIYAKKL